jgi:hypothetical protein
VNPVLSAFLHLVIDPRNANVRRIARPFLLPSDPFPAEVKWQNLVMRRSDFCIVRFVLGSPKLQPGVESGPGVCRFPALGSTEAERLAGESRSLFRPGISFTGFPAAI